jgi:hypothetical protein
VTGAKARFADDDFAEIQDGQLKLKRDDTVIVPAAVTALQKMIDTRLPLIRIEQLLREVDQRTAFSRHFTPVQGHQARPPQFYRTLMAALLSQATNLGVVSMSASVQGLTVDMLRRVLHDFVREDTLTAASAAIVNRHHALPLSAMHGTGTLSSSDAQRFGIRASSLLASYYPRYYGYDEKAIGIYTHVSDQYSVLSTKVISCSPREALYVLDGLLDNNTIGSICVPGSYVSNRTRRVPNNALPRRLTWCTQAKNPTYRGRFSCELPRWGRSHARSRDQPPAIVLTWTACQPSPSSSRADAPRRCQTSFCP